MNFPYVCIKPSSYLISPVEGAEKSFMPPGKKKKERGAKGVGNIPTEDNIGGVISELQIKTVK